MTNAFYNRPIEGKIHRYADAPNQQHDPEDLINALDFLLEIPGVAAVRWHQYTPYFNDGEACVFSAYGPEILLEEHAQKDEDGDYVNDRWYGQYHLFNWETGAPVNTNVDCVKIKNRLAELEEEFDYQEILLSEKFGDPAEVIYDGERFVVEFYDHD